MPTGDIYPDTGKTYQNNSNIEELLKKKSAIEELEDQLGYYTSDNQISLRDYFAAHADARDISNYDFDTENSRHRTREEAKFAYADAMLIARNKGLTSQTQSS